MAHQLGIMQGRLSSPEGGRIQSFPVKTWREEFARARACGLNRIEWIIDDPDVENNPIMTSQGRREIAELSRRTGVGVRSACADFFLPYPLHSSPGSEIKCREIFLHKVIAAAAQAGLDHIDIPFVDNSAIDTEKAFRTVVQVFRRAAPLAERSGVVLCLETSLEPVRFRELLRSIDHPWVKANHDIGNSASLGYIPREEFSAIGPWVACVHIKDRRRGGSTVPLGTGGADFAGTFGALSDLSYQGHFILQVARGPDEIEWTKRNVTFARRWIETLRVGDGLKT